MEFQKLHVLQELTEEFWVQMMSLIVLIAQPVTTVLIQEQ